MHAFLLDMINITLENRSQLFASTWHRERFGEDSTLDDGLVLKPQQEGGGNDIPVFLACLPGEERA
jgi:hypothetical protein